MTDTWNAESYLRFADKRTLPARDLTAHIALDAPRSIIDLGCGPGNSTAIVAERWPEAEITGIDSSPDMLARARQDHPALRWELGDIAAWRPDRAYDLVFSSAALQWLPDHATLFPRLLGHVAENGALAVQMPTGPDAPAFHLMEELAASKPWRAFFSRPIPELSFHAPAFYYDLLAPLAARLDFWMSDYFHILDDAAGIAAWYRGTALRRFLDGLPDEAARDRFVADYTALLPQAYPAQPDGTVLFPFRQLFVIAYR